VRHCKQHSLGVRVEKCLSDFVRLLSSGFKALFGLGEDEKVRRSSISERLSKIDPNYFKEIYEQMYGKFSELYDKAEIEKYNLIRVDSTIVADTCSKLKEGIDQKSGKKLVKFSFSFDGVLPSGVEVFTAQKYSSEESALPEAIFSHVKKEEHHQNIYIIDRGLQSARAMKEFEEKSVKFIIRSKENRKFEEIESFLKNSKLSKWDDWEILKDSKVKLYTGIPVQNKRGNVHHREEKVETHFRLVVIRNEKIKKEFWFLTNEFELTAKEIADLRCLSFHTVNTHRKNIFRKIQVNNIHEATKYAVKAGLIDLVDYFI
jgi:predicted esterase YcpF (UPF0227 family)